jgi:hypothetical protein
MGWDEFLYKMAGDMGIKKDQISLAYRFSTTAKKDLPCALTKLAHFSALWDDARKEMAALEVKKKSSKGNSQKELKVILIDRTPKLKDDKAVCLEILCCYWQY